jgi:CBS domain-containing protein
MKLIKHVLDKKGRTVCTVDAQDSVQQAIQLMAEKDIGSVVVVKEGQVVGIFTERHYARNVFLKGRTSPTTRVEEAMRARPISVSSDQHLGESIDVMNVQRVRHVPVVDNGKLVGIVSMGDILRAIIAEEEFDIASLVEYINGTW